MGFVQSVVAALWVLAVPGLPLGLLLVRRCGPPLLAFALAPVLSTIVNLAILLSLNLLGIFPDMRVYAALLTIGTAAATVPLVRGVLTLRACAHVLAPPTAVAVVALVLWNYAYRGYLLQASNQDGMNHNFWVRRIADTGSALWPDFRVPSSLVPVGRTPITLESLAGSADYAQGWHASVAAGASLFGAPYAAAGLVSVILFWSFALTLGLMALVRYWAPSRRHLGTVSGLVAQFMPQVPGVPMTWGAIPSVVGIAMLPAGFACWIWAFRTPARRAKIAAALAFASVLFVHPPEAATLLLVGGVMVGVDALQQRRRWGLVVPVLSVVAFGTGYLLLSRGRPALFEALAGQKGRYELHPAMWKFATMSVQTCINALDQATCDRDMYVAAVFAAGVVLSLLARERLFLIGGLIMMWLIYMASAAPEPVFPLFRVYTFPWYASYERTAWVVVPIAALFIAYGFSIAFVWARRLPVSLAIVLIAVAAVAGGLFFARSLDPTIAQLRAGPAENQVARPGSEAVFAYAKRLTEREGGIIASPPFDAGLYAYVYDGVPTSNGFTGPNGADDGALLRLFQDPSLTCTDPAVAETVKRDAVDGILFADQGIAWTGQIRRREDLAAFRGWRIAAEGGGVYLLVPDSRNC